MPDHQRLVFKPFLLDLRDERLWKGSQAIRIGAKALVVLHRYCSRCHSVIRLVTIYAPSRRSTEPLVLPASWPACGATRYQHKGHTRPGAPHPWCNKGKRPFRARAAHSRMAAARRAELATLWRVRRARRGMCRAGGVSLPGLVPGRVAGLATGPAPCPARLPARPAPGGRDTLEAEADARWRVGPQQANQPGRWRVLDTTTRPMRALHVGERRRARAQALWASLPQVEHDPATCPADP